MTSYPEQRKPAVKKDLSQERLLLQGRRLMTRHVLNNTLHQLPTLPQRFFDDFSSLHEAFFCQNKQTDLQKARS